MVDLSKYREDGHKWVAAYRDRVGHDLFDRKYSNVWKIIEALPYEASINIPTQIRSTEWEMFVKMVCLYMYDHPSPSILFNDSFTVIYHPGHELDRLMAYKPRNIRWQRKIN